VSKVSKKNSESFIHHLQALKERDKGAMAKLRQSQAFKPGTYYKVFPYVERFVREAAHEDDPRRLALYAVAGLFARHPEHVENKSFATAFSELMRRRESGSIEQRFIALLDADAENIVDYLRQAVSLLAAENIGCDYARLLDDLSSWMNPYLSSWMNPFKTEERDRLRQRWARDFYRATQTDEVQTSSETVTE
jgi:CRISPR system Cascade subunit CasB